MSDIKGVSIMIRKYKLALICGGVTLAVTNTALLTPVNATSISNKQTDIAHITSEKHSGSITVYGQNTQLVGSNTIQERISEEKVQSNILIAQASTFILRPRERHSFEATSPSPNFNYSEWKSCYQSASRNNRNASINVYHLGASKSYKYSTSGNSINCVKYKPDGLTWIITNIGKTPVEIQLYPEYR